jgi:hypothetical protein
MSQGCNENSFWVLGINEYVSDMAGITQTDVGPALPSVCGFVHSVSGGDVITQARFACSYINDVGIRGIYGDSADCEYPLTIGNGSPGSSTVCGLPNSASNSAKIIDERVSDYSTDSFDASTPKWAHLAPTHAIKQMLIDCLSTKT